VFDVISAAQNAVYCMWHSGREQGNVATARTLTQSEVRNNPGAIFNEGKGAAGTAG